MLLRILLADPQTGRRRPRQPNARAPRRDGKNEQLLKQVFLGTNPTAAPAPALRPTPPRSVCAPVGRRRTAMTPPTSAEREGSHLQGERERERKGERERGRERTEREDVRVNVHACSTVSVRRSHASVQPGWGFTTAYRPAALVVSYPRAPATYVTLLVVRNTTMERGRVWRYLSQSITIIINSVLSLSHRSNQHRDINAVRKRYLSSFTRKQERPIAHLELLYLLRTVPAPARQQNVVVRFSLA